MIVLLGMLLCVSVIYLIGLLYFSRHFLPDTKLNDIEVSFLNRDETKELLSIVPVKVRLIEKDLNGTEPVREELELTGEQTDLHYELYDISDYQDPLTWFLGIFGDKKRECRQISGSYDQKELKNLIQSLYCRQPENQKIPQDAHLELTEEGLKLLEADDGSYIDEKTLLNAIEDAINRALNGGILEEIDLRNAYASAEKTDTNVLQNKLAVLQKVLDKKVNITISDGQVVTLAGKQLQELLKLQDDELLIDDAALESYAHSLVEDYSVSASEYIVKSSLKEALRDALLKEEDANVECKWVKQTTQRSSALIEVSYSEQKLYYYENGKLVFSSDVVTGNEDTEIIPYGTYYVQHMKRGATLVSSTYTEYVEYWIGFDYESGGHVLGFHDASWRNEFGGDIWRTDPSHGCVNMPTDKVAMLYEAVDVGTEIYIHE